MAKHSDKTLKNGRFGCIHVPGDLNFLSVSKLNTRSAAYTVFAKGEAE
jgi:hypothetical protein